jgi:hypothetical protein
MRLLTWRIAAVLAAVLVTGCGSESGLTAENAPALTAQAGKITDHVSSITPLDEIFFNSPCNGEDIHMIGTLSAEDNFVGTDEGVLHHELQVVVSERGIGLTTGATYRSHDANHESFNSPTGPSLKVTFSTNESYYFISPTPGLSFRAHFFLTFVTLPNGDIKVSREIGSLECRA